VPAQKPNEAPHAAPQKPKAVQPVKEGKVLQLPSLCMSEGCKQKFQKAGFCMEHFDWFKEGLITKEGQKPKDFDKKYYDYMRRIERKKAA
jgi:hypothetical protein